MPFDIDYHPDVPQEAFRYELLYQGAAGGMLRLMYREFEQDMGRPDFVQDLTYELNDSGPTLVTFRNVRMEVLSAGNEGMEYRVNAGFREESRLGGDSVS